MRYKHLPDGDRPGLERAGVALGQFADHPFVEFAIRTQLIDDFWSVDEQCWRTIGLAKKRSGFFPNLGIVTEHLLNKKFCLPVE